MLEFIKNYKVVLALSIIVHIVCAIFSEGFFHPDEQYYAIDFVLYKLDILDSLKENWEFNTQIRPWLLPSIFWTILSPLKSAFGEDYLFSYLFLLRLTSSLLAFFSFNYFIHIAIENKFVKKSLANVFVFNLFWPLIFMSARTSSENWSTSFLLIAFALYYSKFSNAKQLSGLFYGLAFSFRHQVGIIALSFGLYQLLSKKISFKSFCLNFSLYIGLGVLIGIGADTWGYEKFTLTPINYIFENIGMDKLSEFGVSPWYQYFIYLFKNLTPIWASLIIILGIRSMLKKSFPIVILITILPFILVHFCIGHKELRFLYPVFPFFILAVLNEVNIIFRFKRTTLVLNSIFLTYFCLKPAHTPYQIYEYLWENSEIDEVTVLKDRKGRHPKLEMAGLKRKQLVVKAGEINTDKSHFLVTTHKDYQKLKKSGCHPQLSTYPEWIFQYNYFGWVDRSSVWAIFLCTTKSNLQTLDSITRSYKGPETVLNLKVRDFSYEANFRVL